MDLDLTHPALSDLRARAKKRLPKFAFEYLDSATGRELGAKTNRDALDAIQFMPQILHGLIEADLETTFMGQHFAAPFGVAPLGMSGMIWPGAERLLAQAAVRHNIPFSQSTVAVASPEDTGPHVGDNGWYQHYPVKDGEIRRDMIRRIKEAGFTKLVVTVDVPGESRRERQRRALISMPPVLNLPTLWTMALHPTWCWKMLPEGPPRMRFMDDYIQAKGKDAFVHAGRVIRGWPDWDYIRRVREEWDGDLLVKGVMVPEDAVNLVKEGVDGIWVSNHSARQFEASPASITQLPKIRAALGPDVPIVFDSGVIGGLDICRALAWGADFVMLGRGWHYAVAAFGARGIDHFNHILRADMQSNMSQIGCTKLDQLASRLVEPIPA
ncbi:alpha-hydroxy acid oxidase [Pseudaestuariivita atlantica]|uniref:Alpha-hydroxy acid dehydrogenase n=1 Tax=Pseudaestuariivita atlantica TaxID=1317121 RepID=A0A0L1JK82_9RHOB|nr:alpha-hydroxy acid oxidase [Pseudaestuariivita atlantica]KNG92160.1 alpha-hydroxy acid dehydrogenase [Pseudaestuariivita atlantica]